jgi:hypothetical protein
MVITIVEQINFDISSVALRSDGIILVRVKGNEEVNIIDAKQIISAVATIGQGKKFPMLVVVGEFTLPTPEVRAYLAKAESNPFSNAAAFVIQSLSQKLVGNVYLSFNKPARPTRIFNSEEKAVAWLMTFL